MRARRKCVVRECGSGDDVIVELETIREGVTLRELTPRDAESYVSVMAVNASHLTRLGDFTEEVQTSAREYAGKFAAQGPPLAFGIREIGQLVGSVELVPVDPPRYGLGYWLAESACGRGLATMAVEAIIRYAEKDLGATDIFAGVTHGNDKSIAVLERARFNVVEEFETYTRYHRALT